MIFLLGVFSVAVPGARGDNVVFDGVLYSNGSYSTFSAPGAIYTNPNGINDSGEIVGTASTSTGEIQGFLYSGGAFTTIGFPGGADTYAEGIDYSGEIVGAYNDGGTFYGYVDNGGALTTIPTPGLFPTGINDSGEIVGIYSGGFSTSGFVDSAGNLTSISVPGAYETFAEGINDSGEVVGFYFATSSGPIEGFVYNAGLYTTVNAPFPGALGTYLFGINNAGEIAGIYANNNDEPGVGFLDSGGVFTQFPTAQDPPGFVMNARGINDSEQVVGTFYDLAPEPGTLVLLGVALIAFSGALLRGWLRHRSFPCAEAPARIEG